MTYHHASQAFLPPTLLRAPQNPQPQTGCTHARRARALPTCAHTAHTADLAAAVAAAATLTLANLQPQLPGGYASPAEPPAQVESHAQVRAHARTTMLVVSGVTDAPPVVSVTGVGKSSLHDYSRPAVQSRMSARVDTLDDARREFVLAARLVTAVMMGVMLGVERRATRLNLGVRSVTLLSVSAALTGVLAGCADARLQVPRWLAAAGGPSSLLAFGLVVGVSGGLFAVASARPRGVRNAGSMSAVVGLSVGMGFACGAGLGLLTAALYLAGVAVMRGQRAASPAGAVLPVQRRRRSANALRRSEA